MRLGLSNNRAGCHKALGFLVLMFLVGCSYTIDKRFSDADKHMYDDGWEIDCEGKEDCFKYKRSN